MTVDHATGLGWSEADLERAGVSEIGDLYTSPEFFDAERRLFVGTWTLAASAEQVPRGRFAAVTVAGAPIAIWRDSAGVCRAFHNVCRHRGTLLVEGEGSLGGFVTCPYHQWTFALDGDLVRMPQTDQFPGIDKAGLGLHPVPVVEWHGMIFVCPDPEPPDFHRDIEHLAAKLADHLSRPFVEVARADYTVECNWKLLVENHVDVYHLWYLHQRSLAAYRHTAFEWEWDGPTWWSFEPLKDRSSPDGIGAHLLFPNLMIVTTGDYLATYDARPLSPGRTAMTLRIRSTPDADGAAMVASVRSFLAEDVKVCEATQVATGSPFFRIGPTAERHEKPVRLFHARLRARVLAP